MKGGKKEMKKKTFVILSITSSGIWFVFTILAVVYNLGLGNAATLGGIALMFAWMAAQTSIKD
jgi:hypothetical protein